MKETNPSPETGFLIFSGPIKKEWTHLLRKPKDEKGIKDRLLRRVDPQPYSAGIPMLIRLDISLLSGR
jgi:hypothetical protein